MGGAVTRNVLSRPFLTKGVPMLCGEVEGEGVRALASNRLPMSLLLRDQSFLTYSIRNPSMDVEGRIGSAKGPRCALQPPWQDFGIQIHNDIILYSSVL
jgi:hypothetical protein